MNFCMEDCSIELVVFWLDAEHFRHFDGNDDDIKLFAQHISESYSISLQWKVYYKECTELLVCTVGFYRSDCSPSFSLVVYSM